MPILTKEVEVIPMGIVIQHYRDKGYDAKHKQLLKVKVEDLPNGSDTRIEVLCDICYKNKMTVKYGAYNRTVNNSGSYVCKECASEKRKLTNQKRYGVPYPIQDNLFKKKKRKDVFSAIWSN